jgi:hypothetical protein
MKTARAIVTFVFLMSLLVIVCGYSGCAPGSLTSTLPTEPSPTEPPSYETLARDGFVYSSLPRITSEDLKLQLDSGTEIILIDTRSEYKFKMGHLTAAINITYAIDSPYPGAEEGMDKQLATLPNDAMKVLYCD